MKSIKKIKEGLLIETVSEAQSVRIRKLERLGAFEIDVNPHNTLNFSKGIIRCREYILSELSDEGVIGVKRMTRKIDG